MGVRKAVMLAVAVVAALLSKTRAETAAFIASGNDIDVRPSVARLNVQAASLPGGVSPAAVTVGQARGFSAGARAQAVASAITEGHQRALQAHVDDYSNRDANGDPIISTPGPVYVARAFAMIHVAMYDAFVGISGNAPTYLPYDSLPTVPANLQAVAQFVAIQRAAEIVTNAVFPPTDNVPERSFPSSREAALDAVSVGAAFGETVAQAVLADRANDGAFAEPPFTEVPAPQDFRDHRPDPTVGPEPQQNYAAHWATVDAFGFTDILNPDAGGPARLPPPLAAGYQDGIEQVLRVGARDAEATGDRTAEQTEVGIFWAYDGAFGIGVPPRLYNDAVDGLIATGSPRAITRDPFRLVRLYAVVNVALADAGVVAWREKYEINFWRPTVGIRNEESDFSGGLTPDADWLPLGVPKTNSALSDVFKNPSFPAYPSGHATFGAAALTAAQVELGVRPNFRFSFVSAEFDGEARPASEDDDVAPRPRTSRRFTIAEAIEENNNSRIYLGVHWDVDSEQGAKLGKEVGTSIAQNFPGKA